MKIGVIFPFSYRRCTYLLPRIIFDIYSFRIVYPLKIAIARKALNIAGKQNSNKLMAEIKDPPCTEQIEEQT